MLRRVAGSVGVSVAAGVAAVVLTASPAGAHVDRGAAGVWDGLLHPVTGLDHLVAMVAVGIVAVAAAPRGRPWIAPAAFLAGMVAGGTAGMAGLPLPGAEVLIVASVLLLGGAIAVAAAGHAGWLVPALVAAGLAHGHAHGAEAPESANAAVYIAAFLAATASLHVTGLAIGTAIRSRRTLRVGMGAATVAAGALLLV